MKRDWPVICMIVALIYITNMLFWGVAATRLTIAPVYVLIIVFLLNWIREATKP